MDERVLKEFPSPDGWRLVIIVQRHDGLYSYRFCLAAGTQPGKSWGPPGPHLGLCDSAETAELEAAARYEHVWLASALKRH